MYLKLKFLWVRYKLMSSRGCCTTLKITARKWESLSKNDRVSSVQLTLCCNQFPCFASDNNVISQFMNSNSPCYLFQGFVPLGYDHCWSGTAWLHYTNRLCKSLGWASKPIYRRWFESPLNEVPENRSWIEEFHGLQLLQVQLRRDQEEPRAVPADFADGRVRQERVWILRSEMQACYVWSDRFETGEELQQRPGREGLDCQTGKCCCWV